MYRLKSIALVVAVCACLVVPLARAMTFNLPPEGIDMIGMERIINSRYEDTLLDIARAHNLGYTEMINANPEVDLWLPGEGTLVLLPTRFILPPGPREGIVINLPEMRLYYYPEPVAGEQPVVITHPISIGQMNWRTPLGASMIIRKIKDPDWYPPASIREKMAARGVTLPRVVPAGPDNPLGAFALQLSIPGYLIHGTNKPWAIGLRATHGCIRMYPEDIQAFYEQVPLDTSVRIINQPRKLGWSAQGQLFLEVHPALEEDRSPQDSGLTGVHERLIVASEAYEITVDWRKVETVFERASGLPRRISTVASDRQAGAP